MIFIHNFDLCCGSCEQASTQALQYLCRHFFLTYSFVYITEPDFLPVEDQIEENKNLQIRIQSWEHYAMVLQSYKGVYYFN